MRENHPGLDTPLGVVCYAMVRKRATYFNYDEIAQAHPPSTVPERRDRFERHAGSRLARRARPAPDGSRASSTCARGLSSR